MAIDLLSIEAALELAHGVEPYVDIIEIGTPLIKSAGLEVIRAMRAEFPAMPILADMKTADTGELEASLAMDAGADLVAVLGTADDTTIQGAIHAARSRNKSIVVDLISVVDKVGRARFVRDMGADLVEFHSGADERTRPDYSFSALLSAAKESGVPFAFASGVDIRSIAAVKAAGAHVAVVGSSIYRSADPSAEAHRFRVAMG